MQYLLSAEEYNALLNREKAIKIELSGIIQDLCIQVCNHLPVQGYNKDTAPKPWGCVLTSRDRRYCDKCPVRIACPYPNKPLSK